MCRAEVVLNHFRSWNQIIVFILTCIIYNPDIINESQQTFFTFARTWSTPVMSFDPVIHKVVTLGKVYF